MIAPRRIQVRRTIEIEAGQARPGETIRRPWRLRQCRRPLRPQLCPIKSRRETRAPKRDLILAVYHRKSVEQCGAGKRKYRRNHGGQRHLLSAAKTLTHTPRTWRLSPDYPTPHGTCFWTGVPAQKVGLY